MTTAPKLEPRELARKYLASAPGKFAPTKGEWAEICRALLAAPSAGLREEWQPIETAPRDGTDFDGWVSGEFPHRVPNVSWRVPTDSEWWVHGGETLKDARAAWFDPFGPVEHLSHWRAIPDAPKDRGDSALLTLSKEGGSALTPRVSPKVSLYQTAKRLLDLAGRIERARTNAEENRLCDERDALLAKFRAADAKIEALHKEVADLKHDLARHIEIASDIATDADIRGEANPHDE